MRAKIMVAVTLELQVEYSVDEPYPASAHDPGCPGGTVIEGVRLWMPMSTMALPTDVEGELIEQLSENEEVPRLISEAKGE